MTNALDMAALEGRVVTEGHARICRERGHAVHTVGGVVRDYCPRCGEFTAPTNETPTVPVVRTRGGIIVDIVKYSGTNALVKPRTGTGRRRAGWWAPLEWLTISEAPRPSVKTVARAKRAAL